MAQQDDSAAKEFDPTPRKLEQARKKGDLPRSTDLNTAMVYSGVVLTGVLFGQNVFELLLNAFGSLWSGHSDMIALVFESKGGKFTGQLMSSILQALLAILTIPIVLVLCGLIGQRAIVFAPDKVIPKISKISIAQNAKNKFGLNGLFEFGKSGLKLIVYCAILGLVMWQSQDQLIATLTFEPQSVLVALTKMSLSFMVWVLVVAAILAALDVLWQHHENLRRNRMSRKELQDEAKESEGDPHLKQERRARAHEIATNKMLADIPDADVVIVNPTHFAVALKWDRSRGNAPICVAKGVDEIAARIREIAYESGVPVHRDAATARSIFAHVEIGQEIKPETYRAVAVAIRYAEKIRKTQNWTRPKN